MQHSAENITTNPFRLTPRVNVIYHSAIFFIFFQNAVGQGTNTRSFSSAAAAAAAAAAASPLDAMNVNA
jgi:hypothetical protein